MKIVKLDSFLYALEKAKDDAEYQGRNRAYIKGLRDAGKLAEYESEDMKDSVKPKALLNPNKNAWWYVCTGCSKSIDREDIFCKCCGHPIDWSEQDVTKL